MCMHMRMWTRLAVECLNYPTNSNWQNSDLWPSLKVELPLNTKHLLETVAFKEFTKWAFYQTEWIEQQQTTKSMQAQYAYHSILCMYVDRFSLFFFVLEDISLLGYSKIRV